MKIIKNGTHQNSCICFISAYKKLSGQMEHFKLQVVYCGILQTLTSTEQWDKAIATNSSPGQKSQYWIVLWWLTVTWVNKPHVLISKSCEHIITIETLFEWLHYWQIAYMLNTVHSWIQKVCLLVTSLLTTYFYLHTLEIRHFYLKDLNDLEFYL